MRDRLTIAVVASILSLGLVAAPASAKVFSSGNINKKFPDLGRVASTIKVPNRGQIADISVKVRMSHGYTPDVLLGIQLPDGDFEELVGQGTAAGNPAAPQRNFGAGAKSCKGQMTTFNDDSPTPIEDGEPPFVGTYDPFDSMGAVGDPAKGSYRLIAFDTNQGDAGRLHCWKLDIDFAP